MNSTVVSNQGLPIIILVILKLIFQFTSKSLLKNIFSGSFPCRSSALELFPNIPDTFLWRISFYQKTLVHWWNVESHGFTVLTDKESLGVSVAHILRLKPLNISTWLHLINTIWNYQDDFLVVWDLHSESKGSRFESGC